jgi:hypothetical protein
MLSAFFPWNRDTDRKSGCQVFRPSPIKQNVCSNLNLGESDLNMQTSSYFERLPSLFCQNATMALSLCTTGIVLETGRVIMTGTGHDLLESPEIRAAYLGT